jgi:hypothetical protein
LGLFHDSVYAVFMDANRLKAGCLVEVLAFGGEVLERRVVEIIGDTVYICKAEEWKEAKTRGREPSCVGFNQKFVIRQLHSEKSSAL